MSCGSGPVRTGKEMGAREEMGAPWIAVFARSFYLLSFSHRSTCSDGLRLVSERLE